MTPRRAEQGDAPGRNATVRSRSRNPRVHLPLPARDLRPCRFSRVLLPTPAGHLDGRHRQAKSARSGGL
jgi:hypothetical protein